MVVTLLVVVVVVVVIASSRGYQSEPQWDFKEFYREKEVIKEVPVERTVMVEKEVIVEKVVTKEIPIVRKVPATAPVAKRRNKQAVTRPSTATAMTLHPTPAPIFVPTTPTATAAPPTPTPIPPTFFTLGSTKDEVLLVQGTPAHWSKFSDNNWNYVTSTVMFDADGSVEGWNNSSQNLRLQVVVASTQGTFGSGSTKDEVLAVQGNPSKIDDDRWHYGSSYVEFDYDGRVREWGNGGILKLK